MTSSCNVKPTEVGIRYQNAFAQLKEKNQGAFIPFVVIGDPNLEQSFEVIKALIDAGADALELGIPFSDPSADGVTIQMAALRALEAGTNTDLCLDVLAKVREYAPQMPIGLLLYGNLVFAHGVEKFYQDVAKVGVDSVLVADLPLRESEKFKESAENNNIAQIFIAPPNGSEQTMKTVSENSKGYTYVLSRAGVTGTETKAAMPAENLINTLNKYQAAPPVLGFGISAPEQVKEALSAGALGAISGSAVVKIIESNLNDYPKMIAQLTQFTSGMKSATKR